MGKRRRRSENWTFIRLPEHDNQQKWQWDVCKRFSFRSRLPAISLGFFVQTQIFTINKLNVVENKRMNFKLQCKNTRIMCGAPWTKQLADILRHIYLYWMEKISPFSLFDEDFDAKFNLSIWKTKPFIRYGKRVNISKRCIQHATFDIIRSSLVNSRLCI